MAALIAGGGYGGTDADQFGQGDKGDGDHGQGEEGEATKSMAKKGKAKRKRMAAGRQVTEARLGATRRACCCATRG